MRRKVNFKRSLKGLNSEFSFSQIGCHTRVKEPSMPYYLFISEERIVGFILSPKLLRYVKCRQPRPAVDLRSVCLFPTTLTITPQMLPMYG